MYGDAPLPAETISAILSETWALTADDVEYTRLGFGGYHWRAVVGARRVFVTADAVDGPRATLACYALARRLADEGLGVVRPPLRTRDQRVAHAIHGWWLSVWPWLDGRSSRDGRHTSPADVEATARSVRALHDHPTGRPAGGPVEDWTIPGWQRFEASLERPATGPYAAEARALLDRSVESIRTRRARYDHLTAARAPRPDWVWTHGEPHAANVVHTATGAILVDWDTALWAPRERDLWILAPYPTWRRGYGDVAPDADLLEAYRLQWDLSEITQYATDLLTAQERNPDLELALRELRDYLAPG